MIDRKLRAQLNKNAPFYIVGRCSFDGWRTEYKILKILRVSKRYYYIENGEVLDNSTVIQSYEKTLKDAERFIIDIKVKSYNNEYNNLKQMLERVTYTIKEHDEFFKSHSEEFL